MKRLLFFYLLTLNTLVLQSQETYNYRLSFDRPVPTVLTSIEVTDSCFYVCGITSDTIPPYQLGSLFAKMSFEGEVLWYTTLLDPYRYYGTWRNTLAPTADGNFMVTGKYIDTLNVAALLIKFDSEGDTIFTKTYISPNAPEEGFLSLISSAKASDNGYYLLNNIANDLVGNTDIYIAKVDSIGTLEWGKIYGGIQISESGGTILVAEDKIIIGGQHHNINYVSQDYFSQTKLFQIDNQGNIDWEYTSPEGELWNNAHDVLNTDDGGYLVASGRGFEQGQLPGTYLTWHNYIFKLDAERNFEWGTYVADSLPSDNQLTKLLEVSDNSGYIAVGRIYEPNYAENGLDHHGIISKVSKEGDSLWTRYYNHVVSAADDHIFYDVEETPDGGFVMVGQATDFYQAAESPLQRAWIVKVDQHGCLVPGCHLLSSTESPESENLFQLKLYPNPVTDYLNIYFHHPRLKEKAYFELLNASGKSVLQFTSEHGDITHMIYVGDLASGTYWLTCRVGEEIVTKQIVKG